MAKTSEEIAEYWNEFSKFYGDNIEDSNMQSGVALSRMLKLETAQNILEVGCGTGKLSLHWLQILPPGTKYTSVDISEKMIQIAEKRKEDLIHRINEIDHAFKVGNAENLDFIPDESIDVYLAPLCMHLVNDPNKALKEACRVLKKGGVIGFSVLGPSEKNTLFKLFDDRLEELKIETPKGRSSHYLGKREDLINLAQANGIKVEFCWEQDVVVEIFEEKDLHKITSIPRINQFLNQLDKDSQEKIRKGMKIDLEDKRKNFTPLKTNDLLLIGKKL